MTKNQDKKDVDVENPFKIDVEELKRKSAPTKTKDNIVILDKNNPEDIDWYYD